MIANVPLVVIGLPLMESPVGTVAATDVTVPEFVLKIAMELSDFFKNNTPSAMLHPNSPTNKSLDVATLLTVDVDLGLIGLAMLRRSRHL